MVLKHLGNRSRFLLVLRFQFLKHSGHRARIVSSGPHVLHAQLVGFPFSATAELQKRHAFEEAAAVVKHVADDWTTKQNAGEHSVIHHFHLAFVFHRVTSTDVRDLMRHHAGEFSFVVGSENQTFVYVEESARKSERIHFV